MIRTVCSHVSRKIRKLFSKEQTELNPNHFDDTINLVDMLCSENLSESRNDLSSQDFSELFRLLDIDVYALDEININPSDNEFSLFSESLSVPVIPRSCISKATAEVIESFAQEQAKSTPDPFSCPDVLSHLENLLKQAKYPKSFYCDCITYHDVNHVPFNDGVKDHLTSICNLKVNGVLSVNPDRASWYAKQGYINDCSRENKAQAYITVTKRNVKSGDLHEYKFHPVDRYSPEGKEKKYNEFLGVMNYIISNDMLDDITMLTFTISPFEPKTIGSVNPYPTYDYMKHDRMIADARVKLEAELRRIDSDRKLHRGRGRPKKEQPFSTMFTYEAHKSGFLHCNVMFNRVLTHKERERLIAYFTNNCCGNKDGIHFGSLCQGYVQHACYKRYEGVYLNLRNVERLRKRKNLTYEKEFGQMFRYQFKSFKGVDPDHEYAQRFAEGRIEFRNKRCNIEYKGIRMSGITGPWHKMAIELRDTPDADKVTEEDLYVTLRVVFTWCDRDKITWQHPEYREIMKTLNDVKDEGTVLKERPKCDHIDHSTIDPSTVTKDEYIIALHGVEFWKICQQTNTVIPDCYLLEDGESFKPDKTIIAACSPSLPPLQTIKPGIRIYHGKCDNGISLPCIRDVKVDMSQGPRVAMPVPPSVQTEPEESEYAYDFDIGMTKALVPVSQCFIPVGCEC